MLSAEYKAEVERLATEAIQRLTELQKLMVTNGDQTRAMDVGEAIAYVEGALE
jgi:hypothetical protein